MTEQNITKLINYLNTELATEIPGGFAYIKHKTAPNDTYGTVEILNENENNDGVFETDLIAFAVFSPESKGPTKLRSVVDAMKNSLIGANRHFDGFITRNVDQLGRLDEFTARKYYKTTITINMTYAK